MSHRCYRNQPQAVRVMKRTKRDIRQRDPANELFDERRAYKARRASQWAESRDRRNDDDDAEMNEGATNAAFGALN
jgi:hypothetical protein